MGTDSWQHRTEQATRVLIAARVRLHHDGMAGLLAHDPRIAVIGTVTGATEALATIAARNPDVVVVDTALPGSLETIRLIHAACPKVRLVATAVPDRDADVIACAEAGAAGYATRDASAADLRDVIQRASSGEIVCSPRMAAALFLRIATLAAQGKNEPSLSRLTPREHEIVLLIEEGLSNKQIARRLQIELTTVKNHVHHILEKLGVGGRDAVAAWLREEIRHEHAEPWAAGAASDRL
jgi:two-component system, NarL family, nitrate/nitrite response regulator NarL